MWGWNPPAWAQGLFFGISDRIQEGKAEDHRGRQITISGAGNVPGRNVFHTEGALFYGETKRREIVEITEELRSEVREMFQEMHQYYERRYTPKVKMGKNCTSCSLKELCMPRLAKTGSVKNYMDQVLMEENV